MKKCADAVFVAVAIGLVWFIVAKRAEMPGPPSAKPVLIRGAVIDGINVAQGRRSLLIVISPTCRFCVDSVEFYRNLLAKAAPRGIDVLFWSPASEVETAEFLKESGLPHGRVVQGKLPGAITGTPALIAMDASGRILAGWLGKLDATQEREVLALLD